MTLVDTEKNDFMNSILNSILLNSFLLQSFEFVATYYEIYENGHCLKHAMCNTVISAEHSLFAGVVFRLSNNPTYIDDNFTLSTSSDDLLEDRVQYGRLCSADFNSGDSSQPVVCNIFPQNGMLRFATPNPLRLVEFTGAFKLV